MSAGTGEQLGRYADHFEAFATGQARGSSPLYEALASCLARDGDMLGRIAGAAGPRFNAPLLFAAVHLRVLQGEAGELASHYASVTRVPAAPQKAYPVFRSFCLARWKDIAADLATHVTQTNEVARGSFLYPALALVAERAGRALAILEVGASAGLNLRLDSHRFDYGPHGQVGPAATRVVVRSRVERGSPPLPPRLEIAWRRGLDIHPLDVRRRDDVRWLEALVWPEHTERRQLLLRAVSEAVQDPPEIRAGNAADSLIDAAKDAPAGAALVVFHTNTMGYLSEAERAAVDTQLARIAARRDVHRVFNTSARLSRRLEGAVLDPVQIRAAPLAGPSDGWLGLTSTVHGSRRTTLLGMTRQHGQALAWLA